MHRSATFRAIFAVATLFVALLASLPAKAQVNPPAPPASASAPESSKVEEEAADSPRASMRNFFDYAERGRYPEAALYLDLPRGSEKRAAELATKLHAVLSQRLRINPETLSPLPHGRPRDGLETGVEELGKIRDGKGHEVPIRIVRHEPRSADDEARWVFSQRTVSAVPALYNALRDHWIRERLPPSLLKFGPLALYYWQWLALPVLAGLSMGLGRLLAFLSGVVARRVLARHDWSATLLDGLRAPATLGWALALFVLAMPYLALTLRAEDLLDRGVRALAYLTFFWALLRTVTVAGNEVARGAWALTRPSARALSSVGVRLGRVVVGSLALTVAFSALGFPVTSIIAGLGIGGVALALAAQKTVENLFGSISILADQPFRMGDTIRVDGIEGTVETIGLRSTRVRTADRTLVVFPNGKLADMRIESLGMRDRMRFTTKLQLARTTSVANVAKIVVELKERVSRHPLVRKSEVFAHLVAIGESSYDIELTAPLDTLDGSEFARAREALLVGCVEVIEQAGAMLAVPTRQLVSPNVPPASPRTPAVAPKQPQGCEA